MTADFPDQITLKMFGVTPLYLPENLARVLEAFQSITAFAPSTWSLQESARLPYRKEEIVEHVKAGSPLNAEELYLRRDRAPRYSGWMPLGRKPSLSFELDKDLARSLWPELFQLGDRLAQAFTPDIGVLHFHPKYVRPWTNDDDRDLEVMGRAATPMPVDYYQVGPKGLGLRTYLGPPYVDQIGRNLIETAPLSVREEPWGGVCLDLVKPSWEATPAAMLASWRAAMAHLATAQVFATPVFGRGPRVTWNRGARCKVGGVIAT